MPRGTLLYHGDVVDVPPKEFEWLAFEIEHSSFFAKSRRPWFKQVMDPDAKAPDSHRKAQQEQIPLRANAEHSSRFGDDDDEDEDEDPDGYVRGYLHTYQANRDLKVLYVDGMSAGKTTMGTLDTQNLVLDKPDRGYMEEWPRARSICKLMTSWGYDGYVRTEIGIEVVYCDFKQGLDLLSMTRAFTPKISWK